MASGAQDRGGAESHIRDPAVSWMWWVLSVGGLLITTVMAVATAEPGWRWVPVPLMAALLALYLTVGRRILSNQDSLYGSGTALLFLGGVLACYLPVVTISPTATLGLFVISPMVYMTGGVIPGTVAITAVLVIPDLVRATLGLLPWSSLPLTMGVYLLIIAFAHWFGTWITRVVVQSEERAALIAELRRSRDDVARLSEESGAMAEREHLAREIHDTLAQGFTSIITLAQAVESELDTDPAAARRHVAMLRETAQENLAEARALVAARSPLPLDEGTLEASLQRIVGRLGEELGIRAEARIVGEAVPLPPQVQVALLRTAQEALANIRKHAQAECAQVTLEHAEGTLRLTVEDDGRGFALTGTSNGPGLDNLRPRAGALDGQCRVESTPGQGTRVLVELPLARAQEVAP
jgi:signal transduction histidine kinase